MSYLEPPSDPILTFSEWYEEAVREGELAADAMTLATATPDGVPGARVVLYKGLDEARRLRFVTNYSSRKGRELEQNPRAVLNFFWPKLARQVRFDGRVERAPEALSDSYFASRDRESQLGAWASRQSEPIAARATLMERFQEAQQRFEGRDVERPPHWGMYLFAPEQIELWVSVTHRLHDRFLYELTPDGWRGQRLSP